MISYIKKYWRYIIFAFSIILVCIGGYVYYEVNDVNKVSAKEKDTLTKNDTKAEVTTVKTVFVDVKGAVNVPGVYEIDEGKRIIDAINLAGGLNENADTINLNLSKKLTDEMYIVVYTKLELDNYLKSNSDVSNVTCASYECVCPDSNNDACINTNTITSDVINTGKVSINNAGIEELMTLSGIGESKAKSIVQYRTDNGLFNTIEDIKNVSGIGDAVFNKIKDNITL